jgi:hypothetical protein
VNKNLVKKTFETICIELLAQVFNHYVESFFFRMLILTVAGLIVGAIMFAPDTLQSRAIGQDWFGNFFGVLRKRPISITIVSFLHIFIRVVVGVSLFPLIGLETSSVSSIFWILFTSVFIPIGIGCWYRKRFARMFSMALIPGYALFFLFYPVPIPFISIWSPSCSSYGFGRDTRSIGLLINFSLIMG